MKKIMLILMFLMFGFNLFGAISPEYKLSGLIIDGTTTYYMIQKKDTWKATKEVENPTGTITYSYNVGYSSTTASDFWSVITSTDNWYNASTVSTK